MEVLEKKLIDQECYISSIDQNYRRNNIEIQGILKHVKDEDLESKAIDIFSALNIHNIEYCISSKDIEDFYRLEKDSKKQYSKACKQKTWLQSTK